MADQPNGDRNLQEYPHPSGLPGPHILMLSLLQEALSIDSERWWLSSKLQTGYGELFPDLPHLSKYNRHRKHLVGSAEQLVQLWGRALPPHENTYMVDSVPIPVAHIDCGHFTTVSRKHFHEAPDKDCSAITAQYYIGYELYLVVSLNGVYPYVSFEESQCPRFPLSVRYQKQKAG